MEPKLLTENDLARLVHATPKVIAETLREHGLIVPERDPLEGEIRPFIFKMAQKVNWDGWANKTLPRDKGEQLILAALRRGREIEREAQPAWTPERVRDAVKRAIVPCNTMLSISDFDEDAPTYDVENLEGFLGRLHAALTQPPHAGEGV